MPQVDFGEWTPDQDSVGAPGLQRSENMLPTVKGYDPISDLLETDREALPDPCRGAFRGRTQGGTDFLLAGTIDAIYESDGLDMDDLSIGGGYALATEERWEFDVYGDERFGTNGSNDVQYSTDPGVQFAVLAADASLCKTLAIVGEFLVLGNIVGQGVNAATIGNQEAGLHWSAIGNLTSWPDVATQAAIDVQSDFQILQGDGGAIVQIVNAAEYTLVLRQRQVHRMDYVGAPGFFAFRKLDDSRGATVPGSAIAVGNYVYFLSAEGFLICNGAKTSNIGHEKVDRTILELIDWSRMNAEMAVAHWAKKRSVVWQLPMAAGGTILLGYQYELGRWWSITKTTEWIFNAPPITDDFSMDGDVYKDLDMDDNTGANLGDVNMDTLGTTVSSRDVLSVFYEISSAHKSATFDANTKMSGWLETSDYEMPEQRRWLIRNLRPHYKGEGDVLAALDGRMNPADAVAYPTTGGGSGGGRPGKGNPATVTLKSVNALGLIKTRTTGRYQRALFNTSGDVRELQGFDFNGQRLGKR